MRMLGMVERLTWPLRRLAWKIEEKVIWRLVDALRRGPTGLPRLRARAHSARPVEVASTSRIGSSTSRIGSIRWPLQRLSYALRRYVLWPLTDRFGSSGRDVRIALATVAVAIGAGVGVAALLGVPGSGGGGSSTPASPPQVAAAPEPLGPVSSPAEPGKSSTLEGVTPEFKASAQGSEASAATPSDTVASPTRDTNAKPSQIPPGVANDISALNTARDFAGAFVLYEVGKSNRQVRKTFARTATPALARALRDRPPRLPDSVQVPTAKVQNVVLGERQGRQMGASVSLLRLGDLSELRLTLTKRQQTWSVSEVRG